MARGRRRTRNTVPAEHLHEDPMETIREQADVPTPAPHIPDEEIDAEAAHQDQVADEIATAESELADEGPGDGAVAAAVEEVMTEGSQPGPHGADFNRQVIPSTDDLRDNPFVDIADDATEHWIGSVDYEPPFDPEIFERGPLAAGIRMLNALLTEAKAGYIEAQIGEMERVLDEELEPPERAFVAQIASQTVTASDLPDVAGAYKALVRAKSQVAL